MKLHLLFGAALFAATVPAIAQETVPPASVETTGPTAPDGSKAFGIVPYFGILGGYDSFDRNDGIVGPNGSRFAGAQIEGLVGVNLPLGPVFIGIEGHGAKGFADIDWEYGARARGGFRIGDSGLIYGSAGYTWIEARNNRGFADRKGWVYGLGVEVGPENIGLGGITGRAGPRLRLSVESYDLKSIRPMAGIIFHF
jgi:opacity protein-like surface antigen